MATETRPHHGALLQRTRRISTPRAVLVVAVLGSAMAFADSSSVNIAIPNIGETFPSADLSNVSWVLNAYNIVFAAFLVGGGQLADLLGRRRVLSFGLFLFTAASALCALAPTLGLLVAARVIEAAGAAMVVPASLAIVLEAHQRGERMHVVALGSAVAALAAGLGPPVGGLLITASSWRLIFVVNVVAGVVAFVLARRVLVESRAPGRRRVPDLLGGLVLALAIASLVLAILKGAEWGWANARVLAAFASALLLAGYFALRTTRERTPVIDPSLLRIRAFELSNGATLVMAGGFFAYALCNVLFLTEVWHYSILQAGLALTPEPFVAMALATPTIQLVHRVGHRPVLVAGALIWAAGMAYFAFALGSEPDFVGGWLPGMALLGIGSGLTFPTLSGIAVGTVPGPRFALATSLNSVATQIGAALGVAILIAILGESAPLAGFERGWLFAGGCFVAGAVACLALVLTHDEDEGATGAATIARPGGDEELWAKLAALPSLATSEDEHAAVAPQSAAAFLRNIQVFAGLSEDLLEQIAQLAVDVSLRRGEWLFRQGDPADGVYVVRVGHLGVVQEGAETQTINTLTRGAVLGELAMLNGSPRSASIRALRDTEVLKIDKPHFDALLRSEPELALSLTRVLSAQLQASRAIPVAKRPRPVTIALCAAGPGVPLLDLADELSRAMCLFGKVAVVRSAGLSGEAVSSRVDAASHFGPLIERCERDHDQVLMVCDSGTDPSAWDEFCLARADRVLAVVAEPVLPDPATGERDRIARLHGADLVGWEVELASGELAGWVDAIAPVATFAIGAGGEHRSDIALMARRLTGNALGVVLGGAGARAFAHLGALEVLLDAGVTVDRVGGVSIGAFVGGLLAQGHDIAAIDACCYEEWVRRNPINDYTIPRSSLIKGQKARAMLDRVFGEARIEELSRSFYCASVDLRGSRLVIDRHGPLATAVASSITLPLIAPPARREEGLLVDGSLLDNLPLAPMSSAGEGPVLAIDIKGGEAGADPGESPDGDEAHADHGSRRRLPPLTDTMARIALLSSANTDESARRHADMTIRVPVPGVGLLEFHQIDQAREDGRRAAAAALEDAPEWLFGAGTGPAELTGRRTAVRV
jgi:EmrB/QacA subfamily drug resistance transporter